MKIRKAVMTDFPAIIKVYKGVTKHMITNNIFQWDDLYPDESILKMDIEEKTMYLCEIKTAIAAIFVLNQECDPEYKTGDWQYKNPPFSVIHRLCVNPNFQGMGVGKQAMLSAESILRKEGMSSVRLDVFSQNPAALRLYYNLGYLKVGQVNFRKGLFYLFEKRL